MQLFILNSRREQIGIVEAFEYFSWTRKYSVCGSFELKAVISPENLALLQLGHYLWKNDGDEVGVIEYFEISVGKKENITVKGRFATSLLARRIIWGTETLSGNLDVCANLLLTRHLINPTDPARRMDGIRYAASIPVVPVSSQVSYRNLMDTVCGLCETSDIGIKTVFDPATKIFTVCLYDGGTSLAVFSREYENLTEQNYTESALGGANSALIGGEGEGANRTLAAINGGTGEDRREIWVDAKDLRMADFASGYNNALLFRGQSKLAELAPVRSFDAAINIHGNLRYKIDYDLGQLVTVRSKAWGVELKTRITEIEESYDAKGRSLNIVFGKGVLNLFQKLKGADI